MKWPLNTSSVPRTLGVTPGAPSLNDPSVLDSLPGARDVYSPWGKMRAYEWGPKEGRKVLLLHGLSTPSLSLGTLANSLASKGCRVMLLDLWARGASECPSDMKHDFRLYASEILLAITASPLPWTGSNGGFGVLGCSLGGGLAVQFARFFPHLVNSLVLVVPSGLFDSLPSKYRSLTIRRPWLFSQNRVNERVRILLNGPRKRNTQGQSQKKPQETKFSDFEWTRELEKHGQVDVKGMVDWQVDHHSGYVFSITSGLNHAPITKQYDDWRRIASHIEAGQEPLHPQSSMPNNLQGQKVLLLLGSEDHLLPLAEARSKALTLLGSDNVEIVELKGGHALHITQGELVADQIWSFWAGQMDSRRWQTARTTSEVNCQAAT